jgi:tetratricopeptide (TPR) repeat protein
MLESIRTHGLARLAEDPEEPANRDRHARFYLDVATAAEPQLRGQKQREWLDRLEADLPNLRQSLERFLSQGQGREALAMGAALWRFWWTRGRLTEGLDALTQCLAAAPLTPRAEPEIIALYLRALGGASALARDLGRYDQAQRWCEGARDVALALGQPADVASAFNNLGALAIYREDYSSARPYLEEALRLRRELGDDLGAAGSLNNLGLVLMQLEEHAEAEKFCREGLALYQKQGDAWGEALALNNAALACFKRRKQRDAAELFEESLVRFGQLGDREGIITVLEAVGWIALVQGDAREAAMMLAAAERGRQELGTRLYGRDQLDHEAALTDVRKRLPPSVFLAAWTEGARLGEGADAANAALIEGATRILRRGMSDAA